MRWQSSFKDSTTNRPNPWWSASSTVDTFGAARGSLRASVVASVPRREAMPTNAGAASALPNDQMTTRRQSLRTLRASVVASVPRREAMPTNAGAASALPNAQMTTRRQWLRKPLKRSVHWWFGMWSAFWWSHARPQIDDWRIANVDCRSWVGIAVPWPAMTYSWGTCAFWWRLHAHSETDRATITIANATYALSRAPWPLRRACPPRLLPQSVLPIYCGCCVSWHLRRRWPESKPRY